MGYRKKTTLVDGRPATDPFATGKGGGTPKLEDARAARKLSQEELDWVFRGMAKNADKKPENKREKPNRKAKRGWGIRASNKAGFKKRQKVASAKGG